MPVFQTVFLLSDLFRLMSSESQQARRGARLQHGALAEPHAAGPHGVRHLAATFAQIPQTHLHVPSLTAPPTDTTTDRQKLQHFAECVEKPSEPSSPDEGIRLAQGSDPDHRVTRMTFYRLLGSPGVEVPHMDGTLP